MFSKPMLSYALLLTCLQTIRGSEFEVDSWFFENPFKPSIYIPESFITRYHSLPTTQTVRQPEILPAYPRVRTLLRAAVGYPSFCSPLSVQCCNELFIATTVQHYQCLQQLPNSAVRTVALSQYAAPVNDTLNPGDPAESRMCLTADGHLRRECCNLLMAGRSKEQQKECVKSRGTILSFGLRVCQDADINSRSACCSDIFYGRPEYYTRCMELVPLYVDKQAPCVFNNVYAQRQCCNQIYTSTTKSRRYTGRSLCMDSIEYNQQYKPLCSHQYPKKRCCRMAGLFGTKCWENCMSSKRLPCSDQPNRTSVKQCCLDKFEVPSRNFSTCYTEPSISCQMKEWTERTKCCAMGFRFGSFPMRSCVHQRVSFLANNTLHDVFDQCNTNYLSGSKRFLECIRFPFEACWLQKKHSGKSFSKCCLKSFSDDANKDVFCTKLKRAKRDWNYVEELYAKLGRTYVVLNPDDATWADKARLLACRDMSTNYLLQYACMSQYKFSYKLANNVLGGTFEQIHKATTATASNRHQCAIMDSKERAACCMLHYVGLYEEQAKCMSWSAISGHELMEEVERAKERELKRILADVVRTAQYTVEEKPVVVERRRVLTDFLAAMKWVEEITRKELGGVDEKLLGLYEGFQVLFKKAVDDKVVQKMWHVGRGEWSMCASVSLEDSGKDMGTVYCGSIAQLVGGECEPTRAGVLGWEGGAVGDVAKQMGRTMRQLTRTMAGEENNRQTGVTYSDEQPSTKTSTSPIYSAGAVTINLFGTKHCMAANLQYSCNSFCCDTYFAVSWLCQSLNTYCISSAAEVK